MKPTFTPEENRLRLRYVHGEGYSAVGWLIVFAPLVAFGVYGLWRRDIAAVLIAWLGSTAWILWWIVAARRGGNLLRSILRKYAACAEAECSNGEDGGNA